MGVELKPEPVTTTHDFNPKWAVLVEQTLILGTFVTFFDAKLFAEKLNDFYHTDKYRIREIAR